MKKLFVVIFLCTVTLAVRAEELSFSYGAKAEAVSHFIWRGQLNGGLSFQPDLSLGWTSEHTSFDFGTWWNVGHSDWKFKEFAPEVDVYGMFNLWGAIVGFTHYYYFKGDFFNFGDVNKITGTAQTELTAGYDFSTLFPDVNLKFTWNTMVSGEDPVIDGKRCFSTYVETTYCQDFNYGLSLTGVVGFSPWKSAYTDLDSDYPARDFAFNNITLRFDKVWPMCNDKCELDVYLQGTMNTCHFGREHPVMGAIGVAFSL